jgi:phosphomevalonate kinase
MAVSAEARCTFEIDPESRRWAIETLGFESTPVSTYLPAIIMEPAPPPNSPLHLLWFALNSIKGAINDLPPGGTLTLDSRAFLRDGTKYGLGSSAAICTALTALLQHLSGEPPVFERAFTAHYTAQDNRGSGLDVAAAFHGGLTRMTVDAAGVRQITRQDWPAQLHYRVIWTEQPASTVGFINRFSDWRTAYPEHPAFTALVEASSRLADDLSLAGLQDYAQALLAFDAASELGIFTPLHRDLMRLGDRHGVLYKPCGAGGGDIGIAIADDAAGLRHFEEALSEEWPPAGAPRPHPLDLRLVDHGVRIES